MRYLIAILVPPLGMLMCGKVFQAVLCLFLMLTVIGWPVASVWAVMVVSNYHTEKQTDRIIKEMRRSAPA